MFVALVTSVPVMVMVHVAAPTFPATGVILSTDVVRRNPIRARIRWPRPVAVVPLVVPGLRIPVALDPVIVGTGLGRHAVGALRGWVTNGNAEVDLCVCRCGRGDQERDDCE